MHEFFHGIGKHDQKILIFLMGESGPFEQLLATAQKIPQNLGILSIDRMKGALKMRAKITFALILTAVSSSLMAQQQRPTNAEILAQQPIISIADSTGRRDAVVAILPAPPSVTPDKLKEEIAAATPKPWTAYFLGQTKSVGQVCSRSSCDTVSIRIAMDGTVEYLSQLSGGSVKLFDYPQWNEPLVRTSSWTGGCGGGRGGGDGRSYTQTTNIRIAPTGVSINQLTPTGWTALYTVSGGGC